MQKQQELPNVSTVPMPGNLVNAIVTCLSKRPSLQTEQEVGAILDAVNRSIHQAQLVEKDRLAKLKRKEPKPTKKVAKVKKPKKGKKK